MTIEQVKTEILALIKQKRIHKEEYKLAKQAEKPDELLGIIKRDMTWYLGKLKTASTLINWFGVDMLQENNVYVLGEVDVVANSNEKIFLLGDVCANIEVYPSDNPLRRNNVLIAAFETSRARVITRAHSSVELHLFSDSSAIVNACGDSSVFVAAHDNSSAEVNNYDSSNALATTYDQSSIQTTVYGDGRADIKSYDHSQSKSTIKTCQSINL